MSEQPQYDPVERLKAYRKRVTVEEHVTSENRAMIEAALWCIRERDYRIATLERENAELRQRVES